ncbi:MAG TPA: S-methyl-5'-thioinosine phosphorylase [Wenzhouxiangellaceae bacterium]|nr:S-methyl-5'-thioinosine phosphorylase [Wenzhouxiangellaceae bacterium]
MKLAVMGGTGALQLFETLRNMALTTPFGAPSDRPRQVAVADTELWFLARHGDPHRIPPHKINYRANIHALKILGVDSVLAINAVGGLVAGLPAGSMVAPDQIIDYTWGRAHTFSDGGSAPLKHIDFTRPFDGPLRDRLLDAARQVGHELVDGGCHAVTQGPRLETAAEVSRLASEGCDVVGMTAMPEAALAREAGLDYASLCVVANAGAGLEDGPITEDDIHQVLQGAMQNVKDVIEALVGFDQVN